MDSLQARILSAKAQLQLQRPRIVLTAAQTGLALVTLRIQRDGLPGRTYSTNPIPKFYFKPINAGGREYVKKEKKPNYKGFKEASGQPGDRVTLTFTGRMFRSLQPVPAGGTGAISRAQIVSSEAESAQVLAYNLEREGNFLSPNAQEQASIRDYMNGELSRVIQKELNG